MLINRKIIALIISLIMTATLFMTPIFASEDIPVPEETAENEEPEELVEEETPVDVVSVSADETDGGKSTGSERSSSGEETQNSDNAEESSGTEEVRRSDESPEYVEEDTSGNEDASAAEETEKAEKTEKTDNNGNTGTVTEDKEASEKEWLSEYGVTENENGMLEYTDENGDTWEFEREDPEMFKRIGEPGEYDHQTEITLKGSNSLRRAALGEEQDPYTLLLNPDFKYRYPGCFAVNEDGTLPDVRLGMDISRYQGVISEADWEKLKEEYGIEFVFIRAGYRGYGDGGSLNSDECCTENIENAHEAGVAVGIYYFSQAISEEEARDEAEHCLEIIDGHRDMIDLPVVTDYEYSGAPGRLRGADLSDGEHTAIVNAFCDRVEEEGYLSGIYANKSMLQSDMILNDIPDNHLIWMANFVCDDGAGTYSTSYEGTLSAWQFSSRFTGFGEGRNGLGLMKSVNLDLDFWYGSLPGVDDGTESFETEVQTVKIVDEDSDTDEEVTVPVNTGEAESEEPADGQMSIRNATVAAEDVVYQHRPRICRTSVRVYESDGSRLAAGFDYDRELGYTYDDDMTIERRVDMWARKYESVDVKAGDPVDLRRDIIPEGAVIRVTVTGKGRYKDPDDEKNKVSTTFRFVPEDKREEPVEVEAITEERPSGKQKRLLSRLTAHD